MTFPRLLDFFDRKRARSDAGYSEITSFVHESFDFNLFRGLDTTFYLFHLKSFPHAFG